MENGQRAEQADTEVSCSGFRFSYSKHDCWPHIVSTDTVWIPTDISNSYEVDSVVLDRVRVWRSLGDHVATSAYV